MPFGPWFQGLLLLCSATEGRLVKHWSEVITNGFWSVVSRLTASLLSDWRTTSADSASCFELQDKINVTVWLFSAVCNIWELKQTTTVTAKRLSPDKRVREQNNGCACVINLCIFLCRSSWKSNVKRLSSTYFGKGKGRWRMFCSIIWNWLLALHIELEQFLSLTGALKRSSLLGDLVNEWQRGWRWAGFDTNLTAFVV